MESAPLVSAVTPFYNTREFLSECIESVLRQTYQHWEYVLVDNCSTDGSSEIAASYASRFPDKIRIVRTDSFLTQVQNYNYALTCISSDSAYCKMIQADDWIFPDCMKCMVEVAEAHPSVGIVAAYRLEGDEVNLGGILYPTRYVAGREACRLYFLKDKYLFGSPTSTLIRSEVIRSRRPFFEEKYAPFEDGHACFEVLQTCDFGFVHQLLTFSRWDNGGIMSRICNFGIKPFLHLAMLAAHGRNYFSPAEFDHYLTIAERRYFLYLTLCSLSLAAQPPGFWEFHKKGLASIGYAFDWKRRARYMPRAIAEKAWGAFWRIWDRSSALLPTSH